MSLLIDTNGSQASSTACFQARQLQTPLAPYSSRLEQLATAHADGQLLVGGSRASAESGAVVIDERDVAAAIVLRLCGPRA